MVGELHSSPVHKALSNKLAYSLSCRLCYQSIQPAGLVNLASQLSVVCSLIP